MLRFADALVGNDALKERLSSELEQNTLSHAYILEGKQGSGRHTLALEIAAALSCENRGNPSSPLPCRTCLSCRKIAEGLSPDLITVQREEGKMTLGIDAVRTVKSALSTVPVENDHKIFLIEDADLMTVQAQNALLLSLEEPPAFALFLLLAENASMLLETIRSRAPVLRTEPVPRALLDRYLSEHEPKARQMKSNRPDEYAVLLTAAAGSIGEALALTDPKAMRALLLTREITEHLIAAAQKNAGAALFLEAVSSFPQKRPEAILQFYSLQSALRDLLLLKRADIDTLLFYTDRETAEEQAAELSLTRLVALYSAAATASDNLSKNANLRLTLTEFAVQALG